jgi:hypothetical protein
MPIQVPYAKQCSYIRPDFFIKVVKTFTMLLR